MGINEGLIYASMLLQRTSSDTKLHQMVLDLHHSIFYVVLRSIPHTIGIIILVAGEVYPANSPYRKNQSLMQSHHKFPLFRSNLNILPTNGVFKLVNSPFK